MTYTANVPQSGQTLGFTRPIINSNFNRIFTVFQNNHVAFNESGEGKHKFLQMPEQSAAPTTLPDEGGLYTKVGTNPSETNLFFRAENSSGGPPGGYEYQLTKVISAQTALFATNGAYGTPPATFTQTGGWTFLPGNLLLQYGFYEKMAHWDLLERFSFQ